MSAIAPTVAPPVLSDGLLGFRMRRGAAPISEDVALEQELIVELATADDVASGTARVVAKIRRWAGAARVELWAPRADGGLELVAAAGDGRGRRREVSLGRGSMFVVFGGCLDRPLAIAVKAVAPILRRRRAEEQLAQTAILLGRRNEALEDFAALVAHELKTPLQAALVADDASSSLEQALDLVDSLLEAAHDESHEKTFASVTECLDAAARDVSAGVEITADLRTTLPLPAEPLRVVLRNLLANAVAAGARHVHVTAVQSPRAFRLFVDDDGVGLAAVDRYVAGNGLGLCLCRRIAARFGGALELAPRESGGTRATLVWEEAPQ